MRVLIAFALAVALSACSASQTPKVTTIVDEARVACTQIAPTLAAASQLSDARVQSILSYANAVCAPLAANAPPPATLDANTSTWLGTLGGMLKVLAPIALSLL